MQPEYAAYNIMYIITQLIWNILDKRNVWSVLQRYLCQWLYSTILDY